MLRGVVSGAARRGWQLSPQLAPAKSVFSFARHLSTESEIDPNLDLYKVCRARTRPSAFPPARTLAVCRNRRSRLMMLVPAVPGAGRAKVG
jgi:hypothetical protein